MDRCWSRSNIGFPQDRAAFRAALEGLGASAGAMEPMLGASSRMSPLKDAWSRPSSWNPGSSTYANMNASQMPIGSCRMRFTAFTLGACRWSPISSLQKRRNRT